MSKVTIHKLSGRASIAITEGQGVRLMVGATFQPKGKDAHNFARWIPNGGGEVELSETEWQEMAALFAAQIV